MLGHDKQIKESNIEKFCSIINCKSKINNTEIDNAKDIDTIIRMYHLIKYSDNY